MSEHKFKLKDIEEQELPRPLEPFCVCAEASEDDRSSERVGPVDLPALQEQWQRTCSPREIKEMVVEKMRLCMTCELRLPLALRVHTVWKVARPRASGSADPNLGE